MRREFGPIGPALAVARQVAAAVGPWLLALEGRLPQEPARLYGLLTIELARLVRLGQLYAALEYAEGQQAIHRAWLALAEQVWRYGLSAPAEAA